MQQKSRKPIIFTIVLGLCLLVILLVANLYSSSSSLKPYSMTSLDSKPGPDILFISDGSYDELQEFLPTWQKVASQKSLTVKMFTPRIFPLRRAYQLITSLSPKPKVLILSTQSSEGKETVYHFEQAYMVLEQLNGKNKNLEKYQLSETLNIDQNTYNRDQWKLKNLVDLKLLGVEFDELLKYLKDHQVKLIILTSPFPSKESLQSECSGFSTNADHNLEQMRAHLAAECPQKGMLVLANQAMRSRADDYGFILYDWESELLESASGPKRSKIKKLNENLMDLVFNKLL